MSKDNEKEYITDEIPLLKIEETTQILSLVEEISKLEEKIINLKNAPRTKDDPDKINDEIDNLKKTKNKLNKEMNDLSVSLLIDTSNKENQIKKKSYLIKDLTKKINNYKNILSTYNTLSFSSPVLKKYILSNKINQFLSDEQIDDIMSKTQTIYNNENLIQKYEKEYTNNKEELNNIENDRKKIIQKINEIKENLKMMKEEKLTIKNELVNFISLKETLESIIKVNLPSLLILSNKEENNDDKSDSKNFEKNSFISKEIHSQNRANTINSITEEDNDNENNNNNNIEYIDMSFFNLNNNNNVLIKPKKNWDEIINLYKYEFFYLDPNKISMGISNEIFDTISSKIINENNNNPINNNFGNSILLESKKTPNLLEKVSKAAAFSNNNRYSGNNKMIFSCESPIIKKTRANLFLFNDINDCKKEVQVELKNEIKNFIKNINNKDTSIEKFNEVISEMIMNKLCEYGYFLNKKNLMIYLSCYFKKSFYECMISLKLKFINKDYKSIKKNKKKKIEFYHDQLTKLNTRTETIKNTIILQENKIKMLNNIENKDKNENMNDININNNIKNLKLTLDEQNYIQLCRKANSYINEKNEIEREIEEAENDKKLNKYQGEIKIDSIKKQIKDINDQINLIENESFSKKAKSDEEISKCRKLIIEKFNKMKEYLKKFRNKCSNIDINIYNEFIDTISGNINNKYYKSLLELEKCNSNTLNNSSIHKVKTKNNEISKTSIPNFSFININKENFNIPSQNNFISKTHRRTSSDITKPFTLNEDCLSPVNQNKSKNFLIYKDKDDKSSTDIYNSTSKKKKTVYNDIKNRVKNNNYINIFDSCNNLNNYFFQFQTPSTVISIDDNKKLNNFLNKTNKNEINILSYSSPFSSSSKVSNSSKKVFSPTKELKPTNLINNLKYCVSDKKAVNTENKMSDTIKQADFKINQNSIKNLYNPKPKNVKKSKIINNLLSSFTKEKNNFFNNTKNDSKSKDNRNNSLFKKTFCYFRIINNNDDNKNKYNPFENISISRLCQSPYNFIKSSLSFDQKEDMIKIFSSNQLDSINIKIDKIENSYINPEMKTIIDIFRGFRKYKNLYNSEDINIYIKELKKGTSTYNHLKDEEIKNCCNNKIFSFNLRITNNKIIEFIFCSYEEFKLWNNAICFFIKNNKEFLFNLSKISKFEYP